MRKRVRGVRASPEGIRKVQERMGCLKKRQPTIKGKTSWTNEYLANEGNVSVDTIKRLLNGTAIDTTCMLSILNALGLDWEDVVKELEVEDLE